MNEKIHINSFLKFGEEKNIFDLYENGTIYMNSIQYFRQIEDNDLRGDSYEGVSMIRNYEPGEFEIPNFNFKGKHLGIHLKESYEKIFGNIYSLYCISSHGWDNPEEFIIDSKIKKFGNQCLMIKDVKKFINLVENKARKLDLDIKSGFVNYYDKNKVNRKITLFEKPLEFEYQKEFRFYVARKSVEPIKFTIGSLKNIAELFPCETTVDTLRLKRNIKNYR